MVALEHSLVSFNSVSTLRPAPGANLRSVCRKPLPGPGTHSTLTAVTAPTRFHRPSAAKEDRAALRREGGGGTARRSSSLLETIFVDTLAAELILPLFQDRGSISGWSQPTQPSLLLSFGPFTQQEGRECSRLLREGPSISGKCFCMYSRSLHGDRAPCPGASVGHFDPTQPRSSQES